MTGDTEATFRERTLATQYQPRQELPPNFAAVLKEYAREVLRAQPEDILGWSAAYFRRLALDTDQLQAKRPPPGHYTPVIEDATREVLAQQVVRTLSALDAEGVGELPLSVVRHAMHDRFDLTHTQTLYLLSADGAGVREAEGVVAYETFAYASAPALHFFTQTKYDFAASTTTTTSTVADAAGETLSEARAGRGDEDEEAAAVHGYSRSDVEYYFLRTFRLVDESGTGHVLFADFRNALVNAPLHLTRRDIRVVCLECERSGDGDEVDYEDEVAQLYDRLLLSSRFDRFDRGDDGEGGNHRSNLSSSSGGGGGGGGRRGDGGDGDEDADTGAFVDAGADARPSS